MTASPSSPHRTDLLARELGLPSRLGHTLLLLASLAGGGVVAALLLTEPGLPARTRLAFMGLLMVTLTWSGYAGWVLTKRRVLYARHRVVAGWMGVVFSTLFAGGAFIVGPQLSSGTGYLWAAGTGIAMLFAAAALLVRGRRRVAQLARRKAELESLLEGCTVRP